MRDYLESLEQATAKDPEQRARELSRRELPKRFYKSAEAVEGESGFAIHLDGRPVKTPALKTLLLPTAALAEAVAREWNAQETEIDPGRMPLTRIANSAQDAVTVRFTEVADELTRFAGTDALCYRANDPDALVARQAATWDPVLAWAEGVLGHRFVLVEGLMHAEQSDALMTEFRARLDALNPLHLTAFHTVTTLTGSAVLALALAHEHLPADEVWNAAHIEEDWNIERWGEDAEAAQMRAYKRTEFNAAALILAEG
ncbi:MAG: ATPase [Roseibium sp.]|nr:ATPase [Roseibium sp.]